MSGGSGSGSGSGSRSGSGSGSGSGASGKGRVLVIEDDRDIALGIRTVLTRSGFDVANSPDGKQGLRVFHTARPDLVVLDIGLPTLDGWQVLERIRDLSDVPVLILTAHGHEADKVRGLHGGADDYLTKPFGNRELAARVEALLRRPRAGLPLPEVYDDGSLLVRFDSREVSANGTPIALTPIEYRLLVALVRHPGRTLTPDQLLELAWNDPLGIGPDRVKFGVMRLRRKLGQPGGPGASIEAVRGFGYRYVVPVAARAPRPREGEPG
jgi:DNA-binding response OmpR family regulator